MLLFRSGKPIETLQNESSAPLVLLQHEEGNLPVLPRGKCAFICSPRLVTTNIDFFKGKRPFVNGNSSNTFPESEKRHLRTFFELIVQIIFIESNNQNLIYPHRHF